MRSQLAKPDGCSLLFHGTNLCVGSMEKVPFGQTARPRRARAYGPGYEVGDEIGCFVDSTSPTQGASFHVPLPPSPLYLITLEL